jgi:hypothetical protein
VDDWEEDRGKRTDTAIECANRGSLLLYKTVELNSGVYAAAT